MYRCITQSERAYMEGVVVDTSGCLYRDAATATAAVMERPVIDKIDLEDTIGVEISK